MNAMKKTISFFLTAVLICSLTSCAGTKTVYDEGSLDSSSPKESLDTKVQEPDKQAENETAPEDNAEDFRIGIVTGSFSQSEDDRRGAEAFQAKYGEDKVTLAIYPDNFTEEAETTMNIMSDLADDPKIKAIVVNQAIEGTVDAFRKIKEKRPDILCIAGETFDEFDDIKEVADLVVNNDFVARGYLMIWTAKQLGCDTFVHISFPRHLSYDSYSRRLSVMKAACEEFDIKFEMEEAPDPTTEVGVPGAQAYIKEHVPGWVEKYGQNCAYFCTNDAHTEPLIKGLMEHGGYFIEADLPSPMMGYPGALGLDLTGYNGDFEKMTDDVEAAIVAGNGADRFGTWTSSFGFTNSAGLAEHARNVLLGESELTSISDLTKAYSVFSPKAEWNGSVYVDAMTGEKTENILLVYQDTYIMGDPGHYMGTTKVEVPEKYFTIHK